MKLHLLDFHPTPEFDGSRQLGTYFSISSEDMEAVEPIFAAIERTCRTVGKCEYTGVGIDPVTGRRFLIAGLWKQTTFHKKLKLGDDFFLTDSYWESVPRLRKLARGMTSK